MRRVRSGELVGRVGCRKYGWKSEGREGVSTRQSQYKLRVSEAQAQLNIL